MAGRLRSLFPAEFADVLLDIFDPLLEHLNLLLEHLDPLFLAHELRVRSAEMGRAARGGGPVTGKDMSFWRTFHLFHLLSLVYA